MAEQSEREWLRRTWNSEISGRMTEFFNEVEARLESKSTANRELVDMNARLMARVLKLEHEIECLKKQEGK